MNGIINVLKPPGMTSHDVVSFVRRNYGIKRVGHTGTLDPQAAGVLPVCIGQATRLADFLSANEKEYMCRMTLGITTTTQDAWGDLIESKDASFINRDRIENVLVAFRGSIQQKVPGFSAVKVAGEPLYKKARRGEHIDTIIRSIYIYELELLDFKENEIALYIRCSKGTYIRALCHDLGEMLGVGGHMSFLLRTMAGIFNVQDSYTLEEIAERKQECILPISKCIEGMPVILMNDEETDFIRHGRSIKLSDEHYSQSGIEKIIENDKINEQSILALLDSEGNLHALAEMLIQGNSTMIKPKKVFNLE